MSGAVMTASPNGTATLRFRTGAVYTFAPGNAITGSVLTSMADANGNVTTVVRDQVNPQQITEIVDPVGRKLKFTWNPNNNITSITDPIGRVVSYTYNAAGTLATFTNALGGVTTYTYDAQNRIVTVTDPRGVVRAQNTYDGFGRVLTQTTPSGGIIRFAYTLTNELVPTSPVTQTVVTDPLGNRTTYRFNTQGSVVSVTDASGQTRHMNRAPGTNQVLSITGSGKCEVCGDPAAGDMTYTYDASGNILTQTNELGQTASFTYDPIFNQVTSATDPAGNITRNYYDARGNLIKTTDARGNNTIYTVDGTGLITAIQDTDGSITKYSYDPLGNLISSTDPLNQKTLFSYDGASRMIAQKDPLGRTVTLAYNALDEPLSITQGDGSSIQLAYNSAGLPTSLTDPKGNKTVIAYDNAGRLQSKKDGLNRLRTYTYDLNNNVTTFKNRRGQQSTYVYDALNRGGLGNLPRRHCEHHLRFGRTHRTDSGFPIRHIRSDVRQCGPHSESCQSQWRCFLHPRRQRTGSHAAGAGSTGGQLCLRCQWKSDQRHHGRHFHHTHLQCAQPVDFQLAFQRSCRLLQL